MSAFSNHLEQSLINATLRGGNYSGGAVYIAVFESDPTDAGTGIEVSDSGYARQQSHTTTPSDGWDAPHATDGYTANSKTITFPAIVDGQVAVTHWAIYDAVTGGNLLYHASLTNPKTLDPSDVLSFPVGALKVTLA